ncbi:MAG: aspartate-semialdehyde dehydrogenase [Caldiserica bacterium]|nr:aspartate-semialdehyde dehydrogenase [Caldisericota bacterium]
MRVAVVGATGMVGREMIRVLEERNFPVDELVPLASERSRGENIIFRNKSIPVEVLSADSFNNVQVALFSAGGSVSLKFAPQAVKRGCVVVDNSSAWRMEEEVPLVVPEVNPEDVEKHKGIIANPNCSTIQMVVALKPLQDRYGIKRVVVSTYQAVSGWGKEAVEQLWNETAGILKKAEQERVEHWWELNTDIYRVDAEERVLPYQIAFNVLPHIDVFKENDYTKEEMKMVQETRKIMGLPDLPLTATTVRVPVFRGHAEAVNIELEKDFHVEEVKELLQNSSGIKVIDKVSRNLYPFPLMADGRDEVFVGRIRRDESLPKSLNLWIVSDNLRKGAALNAVQIAELLLSKRLL